jgi:hypothetical protein
MSGTALPVDPQPTRMDVMPTIVFTKLTGSPEPPTDAGDTDTKSGLAKALPRYLVWSEFTTSVKVSDHDI